MKAHMFVNYKIHRTKFSIAEKSEEASFDTEQRSFIEVASEILDALDTYVKGSRAKRK